MSRLNKRALSLLWASVSIYPELADGSPDTANPVFERRQAERLEMEALPITVTTEPTDAPIPKKRAFAESHSITIDRVWLVDLPATAESDVQIPNRRLVIDIQWMDDRSPNWFRRVYKGAVKTGEGRRSRNHVESLHSLEFEAETLDPSAGVGSPPALT